MGRNKVLNKLRKKSHHEKDGGSAGKSRKAAVAGDTSGDANGDASGDARGGIDGSGGEERTTKGGPWRKLSRFLLAYPFVTITVHAEKQLLVVGTVGSGTAQMSKGLMELGVEVGHEASDSERDFCRDGTISWAHGIRFLSSLHRSYRSSMFQAPSACSFLERLWNSNCRTQDCYSVTSREYGCALRGERGAEGGEGGEGGDRLAEACATPFRNTLLQVRNPLRSVAYLAYKSAASKEFAGQDCSNGRQRLNVVRALFPDKFVRSQLRGNGPAFEDFEWAKVSGNCLEVWGWYWVVYNRAMLQGVDGWYRVEDTPPSKVASLAGFSRTSIYEELSFAEEEAEGRRSETEGEAVQPANQPRDGYTEENIGGFEITWEGIAACSGELLQEMSDLALELGYEGAPGLPPRVTAHDGDPSGEAGDGLEPGGGGETRKGWRGVFQRLRRGKAGGEKDKKGGSR